MNRRLILVLAATVALSASGCAKLRARDNLNKGVQAFKGQKFDEAVEFFKAAKEQDPSLLNARLYLATAYATMYIPGAPSEENVRNGEMAIKEFREVLQMQKDNTSAMDGIGSILFNMASSPYDPKKLEESKTYHLEHIKVKPQDPDPYYWIGVIDWKLAYAANNQMRSEYKEVNNKELKEGDALPPKVREGFVQFYANTVDEGIKHLEEATKRDPDYESAYAYLNLLYRQKADMAASADEREQFFSTADGFIEKYKVVKQRKMEKEAAKAGS
jgi:tetratricopeptide (TPR) repeat protein